MTVKEALKEIGRLHVKKYQKEHTHEQIKAEAQQILKQLPRKDMLLNPWTAYYYNLYARRGKIIARDVIAKDRMTAYLFAENVLHGRFEEGEHLIVKPIVTPGEWESNYDYSAAIQYASKFIGGRWPELEDYFFGKVLKEFNRPLYANPYTIIQYAKEVGQGKTWPELEDHFIKTDSKSVYLYIGYWVETQSIPNSKIEKSILKLADNHNVGNFYDETSKYINKFMKKRWVAYEKSLINSEKQSATTDYVRKVLNGKRWPELEQKILEKEDSRWAYFYSQSLNERWPEGEKLILQHAAFSEGYARKFFPGGWLEAEDIIATDKSASLNYAQFTLKGRFKKGESAICKDKEGFYIVHYAIHGIQDRWPRGEKKLLSNVNQWTGVYYLDRYADEVVKGRWEEAEPFLKQENFYFKEYKARLKKQGIKI